MVYFTITRNGADYVDVADEFNNPGGVEITSLIVPGTIIYCSNADGTVPVYIDFVDPPPRDKLNGNRIAVRNISSNVAEAKIAINGNDEISIQAGGSTQASFSLSGDTGGEGAFVLGDGVGVEVSTYYLLYQGTEFTLERVEFEELESFNFNSTSENSDHRHTISLYGAVIEGSVVSLGANTSSYVDLNISGAAGLSNSLFLGNSTLLAGERIIAYDPDKYAYSQVLTIVSTSPTFIRVKNDGSYFDVLGDNPKKVGAGWYFIINARRYGNTIDVEYTTDFVIRKSLLTADTYVGGNVFTVANTSLLQVGERVTINDRNGLVLTTVIQAVPTSTTFTTLASSSFDFLVSKDAYMTVHYTNLEVLDTLLTVDAALGDSEIKIANTGSLLSGDVVYVTDNKGLIQKTTVNSISDPTTVVLSDNLEGDFLIINSSAARFVRPNFGETHSHVIKDGEFSTVSDRSWHVRGYTYSHGHLIAPLIKEINDLKYINGKIYIVGNKASIYSSYDSGVTWNEEIDLTGFSEYSPLPTAVQKIETNGSDILFGTSAGYLVYYSTTGQTEVIPLEMPVG